MKRIAIALVLAIFSLVVLLPLTFNVQDAQAQNATYNIQRVDHNVQILYSGHIVITDTIQISGEVPATFQMGFPFKYGSYILKATAYDANYKILPIALGVQLQDQSGFYGASITIPQGTSQKFTVVFILSNGILTPTASGFKLDFPAYPGFTQTASDCSVTFTLPSSVTIVGIDKSDGAVNASSYDKLNLDAFTYSPATATLTAPTGDVQEVDISSLSREVNLSPSGAITSTDTYKIVNNSTGSIGSFLINLPVKASNVVARDQFGRTLSTVVQQSNTLVFVQNVTLAVFMNPSESSTLTIDYSLPSITPVQSSRYVLNLDLFPYFNYYINSASVTINLPEGATLIAPQLNQLDPLAQVSRNVYQETITISKQGVSYADSVIPSQEIASVTFDYSPLWIAFRPTAWMWVIAIVGVILFALWRRPKSEAAPSQIAVATVTTGESLTPEHLKDFIDSTEEKSHVAAEIRSLDARAQHGRIPRSRYRAQRRTLELHLETLNRNITNLKEILRRAGGSYADILRQLESAEVELNEVELSLKNIEVSHETGEITLDNYRKQLSDLERRKQKAEAKIHGLLLRLR